jgi:glycosyltransferase involved in cell wall biosynthesis
VALRILHVTPYYERAWAYGGIPRVVSSLAHGQVRRGHHVTVCATDACEADRRLHPDGPRPLGAWPVEKTDDGVELRVFTNVSNTLAYHYQFFLPLGLETFLKRHAGDFDVAHLHGCHNLPGAIAAEQLLRARVPYVLATHGTAPRIERRRLAKWIFDHTFGRRLMPGASRLLAVTQAERSQLMQLGVADHRIRVIPHPIDLEETEAVQPGRFRERFRVPWQQIVLYLGKLTPRKNVELLVDAFASLLPRPAGLVIAGNDMGSAAAVRDRVKDRAIGRHTMFTDLLRGPERLEALADATVVAYPSRHEVFGLVPIEALLCGTPVVVSDDCGCGEVIGATGGGRVVAQGDRRALADALDSMLSEPRRWRQAAQDARVRVRSAYASDVVFAQLDQLYDEMIYSRA